MPNTLVHFGVQGALSRAATSAADIRWVFLGCMIPDFPWILRRAVSWAGGVDPYLLVAYCTVQATLALCLVLAGAFACVSSRPRLVFTLLAANSLGHLLLDATQIKWGSGVHLLAPFSWQPLSFAWFWPDSASGYLLTAIGFALTVWLVFFTPRRLIPLARPPRSVMWITAAVLLAGYLLLPRALLQGALNSETRSLATLHAVSDRAGKPLQMDRVPYIRKPDINVAVTVGGEELRLVGPALEHSGTISLQGTFIDSSTVQVHQLHADRAFVRDGASYLGLALFCLVWMRRSKAA